ncbi:MAG: non-hydrolyzing UDP-N-acetylglucosamine 2-epimerase [Acidimicrobiales bacterium]
MTTFRRRIVIVFGTRPEIIKLSGIVQRLGWAAALVHSGQHWDDTMSGVFLRDLGLGKPHHTLEIGGLTRGEQIGEATAALSRLLAELQPDVVVVQGDTNSALSGALAANACHIAVAHVEAGLRSYDREMPEEHNRVLIDHLADLCFAPTKVSAANLEREGIPASRIVVTGNTIVEAVGRLVPDEEARAALLDQYGLERNRYILATIHRPENTDGEKLGEVLAALGSLPLPAVFPLHPRTAKMVERAGLEALLAPLVVVEPLAYEPFLGLLAECALSVSDSGGVQEEVSVLGRPVVVVRRSTERPEVQGIWATLADSGPALTAAVDSLLADLPAVHRQLEELVSPYGDGGASRHCVDAIQRLLAGRSPAPATAPTPTPAGPAAAH